VPKIYLIAGNTGVGKSTYTRNLAQKEDAYIFSGDEWFKTLFLADVPSPSTYKWALERTERIEDQIVKEALKLIIKDMNVILDLGFFKRVQRKRVEQFFNENNVKTSLHFLDIDKKLRWERVNKRNFEKSESFEFEVSREIFEFCETIFEGLFEDEKADVIIKE
jgi:predicted kinase